MNDSNSGRRERCSGLVNRQPTGCREPAGSKGHWSISRGWFRIACSFVTAAIASLSPQFSVAQAIQNQRAGAEREHEPEQQLKELEIVGHKLDAALNAQMDLNRRRKTFRHQVDISKAVTSFLPRNLDLKDAEIILRAAGLSVRHVNQEEKVPNEKMHPALAAGREYQEGFAQKSIIDIEIYPEIGRGGIQVVGKAFASITNTAL